MPKNTPKARKPPVFVFTLETGEKIAPAQGANFEDQSQASRLALVVGQSATTRYAAEDGQLNKISRLYERISPPTDSLALEQIPEALRAPELAEAVIEEHPNKWVLGPAAAELLIPLNTLAVDSKKFWRAI